MITLTPRPLSERGFAPYGRLIAAPAEPGRRILTGAIDADPGRPVALSVTRARPHEGPVVIDRLERHPHSSQTFLPLRVDRWLIVVAAAPEASSLEAFLAGAGVGVVIGRGVWHHGLTVFGASAEFAVVMGRGTGEDAAADDEWRGIDRVVIPQ